MKKVLIALLTFVVVMTAALSAFATSEDIHKGVQLFRKHHYHDAANLLHTILPNTTPAQYHRAQFNLGMVCLANARFYDRLDQTTRPLQIEYLKRLVASGQAQTGSASLLAKLYLGKAYIASAQPESAIPFLKQFLESNQTSQNDQNEAMITLGSAYHAKGQGDRAERIWSKVSTQNPQIAILLAAAFLKADVHTDRITSLVKAIDLSESTGNAIPIQSVSTLANIYTHRGSPDKGFKIISQADLKAFAREEIIGENKVLRFYDPELFQNLVMLYSSSAINALRDAQNAKENKIAAAAAFYIAEAYAFSRRMPEAARAADLLLSTKPPKAVQHRAQIHRLAYGYALQPPALPFTGFHPYLAANPDAVLVGDMISLCAQQSIDDPKALAQAIKIWNNAPGRASMHIGMALGHYYRSRQDHTNALYYLEAVRDKSRKNRIEANPPVLLADLAWAYYHNRQFSEALEIYFTMSKQFPAVRQIQVALQGIYSMEQQSAGDAKIF
ncbi:MAG: hypothetical protein PVH87_18455 [Desulfobacteraceae bacterium]|jgi:tetratricopeptide (TPR) repeat protein